MKKIVNYFLFAGLSLGLASCLILPNSKAGFYIYTLPLVQGEQELDLKIDGAYFPTNEQGSVFYFYNNGVVKWGARVNDFWNHPNESMEDIQAYNSFTLKERWGNYAIQGDTIILQVFNRDNQEFFKRQLIEFKGIIIDDTSFILLSVYHCRNKDKFIEDPITYVFYPIKLKPDSSRAWFRNKRWFKNGLHESRK